MAKAPIKEKIDRPVALTEEILGDSPCGAERTQNEEKEEHQQSVAIKGIQIIFLEGID